MGSPSTIWIKSDVLQNPILKTVAKKLGKTPAQVTLLLGLQTGRGVLPKSTNEARLRRTWMFSVGLYKRTYWPSSMKPSRRVVVSLAILTITILEMAILQLVKVIAAASAAKTRHL